MCSMGRFIFNEIIVLYCYTASKYKIRAIGLSNNIVFYSLLDQCEERSLFNLFGNREEVS